MDVFVSVGTGLNSEQEAFVSAVEAQLRLMGFNPCTIGRNTFSTDAPLKAVIALMDRCEGTVVVALERYYLEAGVERRGSEREQRLGAVSFPTSWNQIEAAMAYGRDLPLLVLVDEKLRCDGLLEKGNDWFVHQLPVNPAALESPPFRGLLESWRAKVVKRRAEAPSAPSDNRPEVDKMSVGQLLAALKPGQLWSLVIAVAGALAAAFAAGAKLGG